MGNITVFRTKEQRKFDKIYDRAEDDQKAFEEMMEKKNRKLQMKGSLTEEDIDEVLFGLGTLVRDNRELHEQLKIINPERAAESERIRKGAIREATEKYYEEEFGIKKIK